MFPKDWVTGHFPHIQNVWRTGLFGWREVRTCSCGLYTTKGINGMAKLHYENEMRMRTWLNQQHQRRPNQP